MADGWGRAVAFHLAPGQAHELPSAPTLLSRLPDAPAWVVADKGYSSDALCAHVSDMGARPAVPTKRREAAVRCPDFIPHHRNRMHEEFQRRIKTQTMLPSAETAAMLFRALMAPGQVTMRKVDGWRTLGEKLADPVPVDLAA